MKAGWPGVTGAATLVAVPLTAVLITSNWQLFSHPFWLDEAFTYLLVADPSPRHASASLAAGVDFNPPGLHLLLRATSPLLGGPGEVAFRVVTFACVVLASWFTFGTLRRAVGPAAAWAGAAALWALPIVMEHAFEARFYAPWLMWTAAWTWLRTSDLVQRRWLVEAGVIVAAVGICTVHYFGVLSLGLMATADALAVPRGRRLRRLAPSLAGPLSLAACLPLLLAQRSASAVPTWIEPTTLRTVADVLAALFWSPGGGVAAVLLAAGGVAMWGRGAVPQPTVRPVVPLLALAGMPILVLSVSLLIQPAFRAPYLIVTVLAVPAVVGLGVERLPKLGRVLACLLMACAALPAVRTAATHHAWRTAEWTEVAQVLAADPLAVVVSQSWHVPVPLAMQNPDAAGRLFMLDAGRTPGLTDSEAMTRDLARVLSRRYGLPALRSADDLPDRFILHAPDSAWSHRVLGEHGYTMTRAGNQLWVARRGGA